MSASILKAEVRARYQITHGIRDQNLPGAGQGRDTRGYMDGNSSDIVGCDLDLAGVHASPHLKVQRSDQINDAGCTADCASRTVEGGQETIAGRSDLLSSEARNFLPDDLIMFFHKRTPAPVSHLGRPLCRLHDIREHQCGQDAIRLDVMTRAG